MFPGWMVEPTTFLRIKIHGVESWRDQPGWFLCTYRCNEKYDDVFRQTYSAGKYHHNNTKWNLTRYSSFFLSLHSPISSDQSHTVCSFFFWSKNGCFMTVTFPHSSRCSNISWNPFFRDWIWKSEKIVNHMLIKISAASPLLSAAEFYFIFFFVPFWNRELNLSSLFWSLITQSMFCCVCVMIFLSIPKSNSPAKRNDRNQPLPPSSFCYIPAKLVFFFFYPIWKIRLLRRLPVKFHITSSVAFSRDDNYWRKKRSYAIDLDWIWI